MYGRGRLPRSNPFSGEGGNPLLAAIQSKRGGGSGNTEGAGDNPANKPMNPLLAAIEKRAKASDGSSSTSSTVEEPPHKGGGLTGLLASIDLIDQIKLKSVLQQS